MAANQDRIKKLEELQRRKQEMEAKRSQLAQARTSNPVNPGSIGDTHASSGGIEIKSGLNEPKPKKTGPVIEYSNFVGVFNMPAKQKTYMYDRAIEVTKEQIQLLKELQEEEKLPMYNYKEDEKYQEDQYNPKKKEKKIHQIPDEEVEKIFSKPQFKRFIRKGSDILEQELSDTESLYEDMIERNDVGVEGDKAMLNFSFNFLDESIKSFSVTNIVWSKTNADLMLATYATSDITEKNPSKILVWSMKNKLKALHVINCEKKITRAIFHPKNENMIFAATYTGNIIQYTIGGEALTPIKNYNVGEKEEFHATPIFVLEFYFKDNNEYLISLSVDGKICIWNINFLFEPVVNKILEPPVKKDASRIKLPIIYAMSSTMLHPFSDEATLLIGTNDNLLILYKVSSLFGSTDEIVSNGVSTEHHAPICTVSGKYDQTHSFLQDLYLSGSFDYDVQLWKITEGYTSMVKRFPIHNDYVVAVEWNPVHPALFASCDCNGRFLIFDLIANANYFTYEGEAAPSSTMRWSPDGSKLAFGSLTGEVQIWQMRKKYLKYDEEKLKAARHNLI